MEKREIQESTIVSITVMIVGFIAFLAGLGIKIGGAEQIFPPMSFLIFGLVLLLGGLGSYLYTARKHRTFF